LSFNREEGGIIVKSFLLGDKEAGDRLVLEYERLVIDHARKWFGRLNYISYGMLDFDDICQEIWLYIFINLHSYDSEKAGLTTWLYKVCDSACNRMRYCLDKDKRRAKDDEGNVIQNISLNEQFVEDSEVELLDSIMDPSSYFNDKVIDEISIYERIYLISKFVRKLNYNQQVYYLHHVKKVTTIESAAIFSCTRQNVSRIQRDIRERLIKFLNFNSNIDTREADKFAIGLLSNKDDDILSDELKVDLGTIKICRAILEEVGLYENR
jgi:RNA polymerase sigma-70 factor (ECF subfamily)